MATVRAILEKLKSDKIKERQEGLVSLRAAFSKESVVDHFWITNGVPYPKQWLPVFQALFQSVRIEKAATVKKSKSSKSSQTPTPAAALRRISDAASAIRWMTERVVHFMDSSVTTAVFEHLTQMLSSSQTLDAKLYTPVALDYAKALKCLVSYQPHLEHMEVSTWIKIVEISFNVVLGDPIRSSFGGPKEPEGTDNDSDMYEPDEPEEVYEDSDDTRSTSNKRKRHERTPTPLLSPQKSKAHVKSKRRLISVTHEQVEFMSILSVMISSPAAPIFDEENPALIRGILSRLERFLDVYPSESSLLRDYLHVLSAMLRHLSFNKIYDTQCFARTIWPGLIGLWGTKDKSIKEELIVVLRRLFQFVISPNYTALKLPHFDCAEEIGRLWSLLDSEADSRWGVEKLSFDALRLTIIDPEQNNQATGQNMAFVAKTFRAGWNFNAGQALAWAILELRADCAGQLLKLSESMDTTAAGLPRTESKRIRLSDPISSLIQSIQSIQADSSPAVRIYHLQTMLFFIDRHWGIVHDSLKDRVVNVFLQYLGFDDPGVQSWVFLNLAAVVYGEGIRTDALPAKAEGCINPYLWDAIWTHAMRRANVPLVCRAACHTAQMILCSNRPQSSTPSHVRLDYQRILQEIETLTKDIDVQGPAYPYDSVCDFLSQCLSIASQDVRLYRMRFEDKVLSWFIDAWRTKSGQGEMAAYTVQDVLYLLETICGLSTQVDLVIKSILPQSDIVDVIEEENKFKVIQDFVLYATLPPLGFKNDLRRENTNTDNSRTLPKDKIERSQLVAPSGRERKVSSFLLKAIESLIHDWETLLSVNNGPAAEIARKSLDFVIVSITFESMLTLNGTTSNRSLLQSAGKLLSMIIPFVLRSRWTTSEKLIVLHSLEVLVSDEYVEDPDVFKDILVKPQAGSGIKDQVLQDLLSSHFQSRKAIKTNRLNLLRAVWQNPELQDTLQVVMKAARQMLLQLMGQMTPEEQGQPMDIDNDGFDPIRINDPQSSTLTTDGDRSHRHILQVCVGFLAGGPFFQSPSGEATRDKQLVELVIESIGQQSERFFLLSSVFLDRVRQGMLRMPLNSFGKFLDEVSSLISQYQFSKSSNTIQLAIDLLECGLDMWESHEETHFKIRRLCFSLSRLYRLGRMRLWASRDVFARFMDKYLSKELNPSSWLQSEEVKLKREGQTIEDYFPIPMLLGMNGDLDIRVRFRVATIHCRVISLSEHAQLTAMYETITESLPKDIDDFEHILTRTLTLGNIMIVSSFIRRGPYWHLLEACLFSDVYSQHIEAVLVGVSQRLGLQSLSSFFEAYAAQFAFSIANHDKIHDFIGISPQLLGYRDKRQCAEAVFHLFTPTNILIHKDKSFENHCKILQKTPVDGLKECFGQIVGFYITYYIDKPLDIPPDELAQHIKERLQSIEDYENVFRDNVDSIAVRILSSLGDQDYSDDGPIQTSLNEFDQSGRMTSDFKALTCFRVADSFISHSPNLPAFSTKTILHCLSWLRSRVPEDFTKATIYHVVQELFNYVHRTPLVNEQIRLINALSLWLAYCGQELNDITLLQTVVHGATLILLQSDLARSAQSILEWAFRRYRKGTFVDPCLANTLIRICSIAYDFSQKKHNPSVEKLGNELSEWIDRQAYSLSKPNTLNREVLRALPAWPQQPSSQLLPLYDQSTVSDLSSILSDDRITSNKFRLVRKFKCHAAEPGYDDRDDQFANDYFWRLRQCMPNVQYLQDEDVLAFADLLSLHHGHIGSFGAEEPSPIFAYQRTRQGVTTTVPYSARDSIRLGLLLMLDSDNPLQVSSAYHTLRLITAVTLANDEKTQLPSNYLPILDYMKIYPKPTKPPVSNDIYESLRSDLYLDSVASFSKWVTSVSVLFSNTLAKTDPFFGQLSSILSSDSRFAEMVLPILVRQLLLERQNMQTEFISFQKLLTTYFTNVLSSRDPDIRCIRSVIDIVLHLRCYTPFSALGTQTAAVKGKQTTATDKLAYNKWLRVDYKLLAYSAIRCGAYTTAVLFVELAYEDENDTKEESIPSSEDILYEIYAHIDEPDGFYGIKTHNLQRFLIKRFHHEQQWDKAFRFHGAALEAGDTRTDDKDGLVQSFHSFGFNHLAMESLRNSSTDPTGSTSSINYSLGWRTETWDLPDHGHTEPSASLYRSLRVVYRERDACSIEHTIRASLLQEMERLRELKSENLVDIRRVSKDLMCLSQVMQWKQDSSNGLLEQRNFAADQWVKITHIDPQFEFANLESIMATRIALVRSVRQREERQQIGNMVSPFILGLKNVEKICLIRLSEAARRAGQIQIALNSVMRAQHLDTASSSEVSEEFANVLWLQKEEKLAVQYLQDVLNKLETDVRKDAPSTLRKAALLARLGSWTSDACLEKPATIWEKHFSPVISLLDDIQRNTGKNDIPQSTIYRECALFAEHQFLTISKSTDPARWRIYAERKKQEIEDRKKELLQFGPSPNTSASNALLEQQRKARQLLEEDTQSFMKHDTLRDTFLKQAIEMHSRCLETSDKFDNDSAIRFVSLWFSNFDEPSTFDTICRGIERTPSRKFIFLAHQLTARVSSSTLNKNASTLNQETLYNLVLRMCMEHPFHSFYQVYCLLDHDQAHTRKNQVQKPQPVQNERSIIASNIIQRLRTDPSNGPRIQVMENLCNAYLDWALYNIKEVSSKATKPPITMPAVKLANVRKIVKDFRIPVVTSRTPIDPSMRYENCSWIEDYDKTYTTAGGINLPKINVCRATDGTSYKQLFKGGKDDLRQDAVMEQVFDLVNNILRHDRETRRRDLRVRDYKVVPLSSKAGGILEFVENTAPMRGWLGEAHKKYRPQDLPLSEAGSILKSVQTSYKSNHKRQLLTFQEIQGKLQPVMRHYFTEKHKIPMAWFRMRLNYTRSVATTSIVGHVLGIGDRHSSNILLENETGEVVHIDFGIAFDQGKLLTYPEKVPFRMTRDMVDGMGISGTSGVFQRCSEETLRVLRDESDLIMTVLEVFRHDPLHSWTASEVKVQHAQGDNAPPPVTTPTATENPTHLIPGAANININSTAEESADRALNSVLRKLDKSLSVESTVNELVAEATDQMNLATIYFGWGPYL